MDTVTTYPCHKFDAVFNKLMKYVNQHGELDVGWELRTVLKNANITSNEI